MKSNGTWNAYCRSALGQLLLLLILKDPLSWALLFHLQKENGSLQKEMCVCVRLLQFQGMLFHKAMVSVTCEDRWMRLASCSQGTYSLAIRCQAHRETCQKLL